jgi:peptidoglycan/LPS O-acetylase OafA/YrhL
MAASRPYYPSFDGLRCLAILPIVWHHSTTGPQDGVLGRGPLGVDLFFVVSGFLITSLLLHERRGGGIALGAFWARRSLRIFPLYYLVLGAFVVHALFVREPGPVRDHFLRSVPFYATYTSNWFLHGPVDHAIVFAFAWSLAAEEQFYLVWPPVLRACRGALVPAIVMGALVALDQAAERDRLAPLLGEGLALRMLRSFATPIGLGALLALATDHPKTARVANALLGRRCSSPLALALVAIATATPWTILQTHLALAALVGACALRRDHLLAPLFENRVVRHVGSVSYGIYLLNVPVVSAVRSLLGPRASAGVVFVMATLASVAVATAVYRWVERPFLALRERFRAPTTEALTTESVRSPSRIFPRRAGP